MISSKNWTTVNSSLFSSYIHYITAYQARFPTLLINDKNSIEIILVKLVESNHYNHFFSFMKQIEIITGFEGFYNTGYLQILINGIAALLNTDHKMTILKIAIMLFCSFMIN